MASETVYDLDLDKFMDSEPFLNQVIEANQTAVQLDELTQKVQLILDIDGVLVDLVQLPFPESKEEYQMRANDRCLAVAPISKFGDTISQLIRNNPGKYQVLIITARKKRAEQYTRKLLDQLFDCYELIMMPDCHSYANPVQCALWKASQILFSVNMKVPVEIYEDDVRVNNSLETLPKRPKMPLKLKQMTPEIIDYVDLIPKIELTQEEIEQIDLSQHYKLNGVIDDAVCRLFIAHILGKINPWAFVPTMREFIRLMKQNYFNRLYLDNIWLDHEMVNYLWNEDVDAILKQMESQPESTKIRRGKK